MSEERFDRIDQALERLEAGQNHLGQRIDVVDRRLEGVDRRFEGVTQRIEDLDRHMHVLHEDAIARIAATREYNGPTREEFAELKEMIGRRLDPLEATVRHHSAEIDRLKQGRA